MQNQHFVPRIYLKQFCKENGEFLFGMQRIIHTNSWTKPKAYNIASICYEGDYYNLDKEQASKASVDHDIIEKEAFGYERKFINELIRQVENDKIEQEIINERPFFMLSMKKRNPNFKKNYNKEQIEKSYYDTIAEKRIKYSSFDKDLIDGAFRKAKELTVDNPKGGDVMYKDSLLRNLKGEDKAFQDIHQKLLNYPIVIFRIEDDDDYFVTCDSPGFSVDNQGGLFNTKYKDDAFHFLPLSSKYAIAFFNPDNNVNLKNNISNITLGSQGVKSFNIATSAIRNSFVYCEDKDYLDDFKRYLK